MAKKTKEEVVAQNGVVVDNPSLSPSPQVEREDTEVALSKFIGESDGYRFDFRKIHATDVKRYYEQRRIGKFVTTFAAIEPSVLDFENTWGDAPGDVPFKIIKNISNAFLKAARNLDLDATDAIRFNVEDISGSDVDAWNVYIFMMNVEQMAEMMDKYAIARKKPFNDLMELEFADFVTAMLSFQEALLDLAKN